MREKWSKGEGEVDIEVGKGCGSSEQRVCEKWIVVGEQWTEYSREVGRG